MNFVLPTVMGLAGSGAGAVSALPAPLLLPVAQIAEPSGDELYTWLKVAVALLAMAALVKQIFPGRRPPIDVDLESLKRAISETYVTKDDLNLLRTDINDRMVGMNHKVNGLNERVSNVFGELRQLTGRFDMLNEFLQRKGQS